VLEGGISNRDWCSNRGSLASNPAIVLEAFVQGVIQGDCWCEVADEPVVVIKVQPMKASNGVEGKTEPTINIVFDGVNRRQKLDGLRRGEVFFKCIENIGINAKVHKRSGRYIAPARSAFLPFMVITGWALNNG
jgi:hypothetical protein